MINTDQHIDGIISSVSTEGLALILMTLQSGK